MNTSSSTFSSTPLPPDLRYMVYVAEIRKRLSYVGLSLLSAFLCAYTQRVPLMYSMTLSLQKAFDGIDKHSIAIGTEAGSDSYTGGDGAVRLIFTDVEEAFYTLLSVSLFWCLLVCLPVLVYHILCFLQPGFYAWQSVRAWFSACTRLALGYAALKLVDLFVISNLLSFFYSFQIKRTSLCLDAETKVVSYVSLYVFVQFVTVMLLLFTGLWGFYRQRRTLNLLGTTQQFSAQAPAMNDVVFTDMSIRDKSPDRSVKLKALPRLRLEQSSWNTTRYRDQRGKVWWGCLLLAALISPPEISSQLGCACLFIVWSELVVWLGYSSLCRLYSKISFHLSC